MESPSNVPSKPKVIAVMPAYNAESTLERTIADIPAGAVDEIILVDDCSTDNTVELARSIGLTVIGEPPSVTGAVHDTATCPFPAVPVTPVDADGTVSGACGVTGADAVDAGPVPIAFVAVTVNV